VSDRLLMNEVGRSLIIAVLEYRGPLFINTILCLEGTSSSLGLERGYPDWYRLLRGFLSSEKTKLSE
jgi:hypothetical protein